MPDLADQCDDSVPDLEDEHGDNQSRDWLSDKSSEIVYTALYYHTCDTLRKIIVRIDDPKKYIRAEYKMI